MKHAPKVLFTLISICLGLFLVSLATHAQSFFGSGSKPSTPGNATTPAIPPSRVMSQDEFNKVANQISQQNANALAQEAQKNIPPITPQQPTPATKTGQASRPAPSSVATPAPSPTTTASPAAPAAQPAAPAQPPASSQIYTGFGTSPQNAPKSGGDSNTSSTGNTGWRIQY